MKSNRISFAEILAIPRGAPGLYRIFFRDKTSLKVGISKDLRSRLRHHLESKEKYLKIKCGRSGSIPDDVLSKRSILAKHLFFDRGYGRKFDLETERGRNHFLSRHCFVRYTVTRNMKEARNLEKTMEAKNIFRYQGRVRILRTLAS